MWTVISSGLIYIIFQYYIIEVCSPTICKNKILLLIALPEINRCANPGYNNKSIHYAIHSHYVATRVYGYV